MSSSQLFKQAVETHMGSSLLKQKSTSFSFASFVLLGLLCFSSFRSLLSSTLLTVIVLVLSTSLLSFFKSKKVGKSCMQHEVAKPSKEIHEGSGSICLYGAEEVDQIDAHSPDCSNSSTGDQVMACLDDESSISDDDDDGLIEIALPGGQPLGPRETRRVYGPGSCGFRPEFSPELLFRKHGLMELLNEINEEDNLIEIDITMGSIKCSMLQGIKA